MVRILQFTDLHYRQVLPGHSGHAERMARHGPALLAALAERITHEDPDLVAFTGDIIDAPHDLLHATGTPEDTAELTEGVRQDYATMRRWLDSLNRPWMIAPGNHDFRPIFLEVFGDAPRELSMPGMRAVAYYDWEVRENTSERLKEELARFEDIIGRPDSGDWTVHFQHFLIWPIVDHGYPMRYRTADNLRDQLADAPARNLVLCGHFHEGTEVVTRGNARFAVCPSMTEAPHRYRVFDLSPEGRYDMREEHLDAGPLSNRPLLLIDRTSIVTEEPDNATDAFALRPDGLDPFQRARAAGFTPVLVSAWNDPQAVDANWAAIMKRHDRMFTRLSRASEDQGDGLVICIDEARPVPVGLPSEPITRYSNLRQRVAKHFGVSSDQIYFLSANAERRAQFGDTNTGGSIDMLAALPSQEKETQA